MKTSETGLQFRLHEKLTQKDIEDSIGVITFTLLMISLTYITLHLILENIFQFRSDICIVSMILPFIYTSRESISIFLFKNSKPLAASVWFLSNSVYLFLFELLFIFSPLLMGN